MEDNKHNFIFLATELTLNCSTQCAAEHIELLHLICSGTSKTAPFVPLVSKGKNRTAPDSYDLT